jgi:hypothetical protein
MEAPMTTIHLLATLLHHLHPLVPALPAALRLNLALLMLALAQSPNCHLATLATVLPVEAQRDNLIQRLRRWLSTRTLTWRTVYHPMAKQLLANWQGAEIALVMDRTDLNDRWSLLTVGIATDHRVIPLSGRLLPYGGTGADIQIELLRDLPPMLPDPKQVRVTFFGDAEFRAVELQRWCQAQGWHWQVGVKRDTWFRDEHGVWQQLRDIPIQRGERVYRQRIWLTQEHAFGPVNLMVDWTSQEDTPRCVVLDQPADRRAWRRGRKRYWIEPTFRDLKSAGFDLEQSELQDRERIERMVLAMLLTFVWMLFISQQMIASGQRSELEARHKRDYSRFRLGRDWLRRCLALGKPIPVGFIVGP